MRDQGRSPRRKTLRIFLAALLTAVSMPALSQGGTLRVELNKLEPMEAACRAYLLFKNSTGAELESLKLDLVMFNPDGIINRRLAVEGGPLPAGKTSVKLFDIDGVSCTSVGRVLLNGVLSCADSEGARQDCLDLIQAVSRSDVEFFK